MTSHILTQEELKEQLHYDPETGVFTWLVSNSNRVKIGQVSGRLHSQGYVKIKINNKEYGAHRLAWLYMAGSFPDKSIDHRDCIRNNNKWLNLREATIQENSFNSARKARNTSGYTGVTWNKSLNTWTAYCSINGKQKYLGRFNTAEEASEVYQQAALANRGEFYRNTGRETSICI